MTIKSFQFVKSGVVIREFTDEFYSLNWTGSQPMILNKDNRAVVFIPSPQYYDYIEVSETE